MESLSSLGSLSDLRLRSGVDMRPTLLRVLTDLYVQKLAHTPDEERHYTELALRLLDAVDLTTRVAVATRLARHLSPPRRIIARLAADLPDVAAAVRAKLTPQGAAPPRRATALAHATPPGEPGPAPQPAAAAERHAAGAPAPDIPAPEDIERDTIPAEAGPATITPDLAAELNELFFASNAEERRLILLNLELAAPLPAHSVAGMPHDAGIGARLEAAALTRNREDFARHLAQSLNISGAQARRIAGDELGEPIVTAAKALRLPRDVVYRILLFVNTTVGHSVERVHTLAALYDEMNVPAAEHMAAIWQALQPQERRPGQHRSLLWNDEARARARSATATVRRAPATQRVGERRDAS